ncbi:MAG: HAD-IIB family hydrolase [Candidatus Acidiferrales bacterium]
MRYFCLVTDYDGTIAHDGIVSPGTIAALKRVRESGRKVILATGRQLDDLLAVFPELNIFDRVIAENGGLLYRPSAREKLSFAKPASPELVAKLREIGVTPLSVGETIIATWRPNETAALDAIRTLGLDLQITFNKDAVMILPSGINKGTGVTAALNELGLSPHNAVGVGDAENDHGFLEICECKVAVQNALQSLKDRTDFVTDGARGDGVEQLIEKLLASDLADLGNRLGRHGLHLGDDVDGKPCFIDPYGTRLAIAGPSGSGKSTFVSVLTERLISKEYQVCIIDPEGDYEELEGFVTLGASGHQPDLSEILGILEAQTRSVTVNLLGIALADRPSFFQKFLAAVQELRSRTGRPHWVIIDEAHHMLPASRDSASRVIPLELASTALVTVNLHHVARPILEAVNTLVLVGADPVSVVNDFNAGASTTLHAHLPQLNNLAQGEVVIWPFKSNGSPVRVRLLETRRDRKRHRQKYAAGELGEDKSFYFRGPGSRLNLRAQNMTIFAQLAEGVDDDTWTYHLRNHDYSRWVRDSIKDDDAAAALANIEGNSRLPAGESRRQVLDVIRQRYTAPA